MPRTYYEWIAAKRAWLEAHRRSDGVYGYFPKDAPIEFSYTKDFGRKFGDTGKLAKMHVDMAALASIRRPDTVAGKSLIAELEVIANKAALAELSYLETYLPGFSISNLNMKGIPWKDIINGFNALLLGQDTFQELIKEIRQGTTYYKKTDKKGKESQVRMFKDFSATFSGYVDHQLREYFKSHENELLEMSPRRWQTAMENIMVDALKQALNQKVYYIGDRIVNKTEYDKSELPKRIVEPYKELKEKMGELKRKNPILRPMLDLLIKDLQLEEVVKEGLDEFKKRKGEGDMKNWEKIIVPRVKTWTDGTVRGTIKEDLTGLCVSMVYQSFGEVPTIKVMGNLGAKPDVMISHLTAHGQVDIQPLLDSMSNNGKAFEGESNRKFNIEALQKFVDKNKEARGHIVFISDKSYTITERGVNYGHGFGAQTTSLANMATVLNFKSQLDVDSLINYLANTGDDMIAGRADPKILQTLATQIGYFMFDNLSIEGDFNMAMVNLFELSGIYVPLSVYMTKMIAAFKQATKKESRFSSYAKVSMEYGGNEPGLPWKTSEVFEDFRNGRIHKTNVTFSFLSGFKSFLKELVVNQI